MLRYLFPILMLWSCQSPRFSANAGQPNIVWLVSEDNSKHFLQLYDSTGVTMQSLNRLAANGIVFNHAFSNAPVCSVARSTLISGCYAPRIGAQYHRKVKSVPMPGGLKMFPYYLRRAGYYTTNNAKEDYNLVKGDSVWSESSRKATYRNRPNNTPFFHVQNFGVTHEGQLHFSTKEIAETPTITKTENISLFPYHPDTRISRYTYAREYDHHLKLDSLLNDFIQQLEADQLLDDTFIFYYGDHGGVLPGSKGYLFETGLHIPLVVYVPRNYRYLIAPKIGSRVDGFVSFVDFAPTVLKLADIPIPEEMDGKPFLGAAISDSTLSASNVSFGYADRFDEKYDLVRSIRRDKYKYIRNYQPFNPDALHNFYRYRMKMYDEWRTLFRDGQLNDIQQQFFQPKNAEALYDLESDPFETINLAEDPAYENTLTELRRELQQHLKNLPDLSFYPEPYFLDQIEDPVRFGQSHQGNITQLIDLADLMLLPLSEVKAQILTNLTTADPWKRYWALIVCSSLGEPDPELVEQAQKLAISDTENLVRMRALEYLMLVGIRVDGESFKDVLSKSKSMAEANLMLNSIAMLKETMPEFSFPDFSAVIPSQWIEEDKSLVPHRLTYLQ